MYREVFAVLAGALVWFVIAGPDMIMTGLESRPTPSAECICCCAFLGKYTLLTECVALSSSLVVGARKGTTVARCFERDLSLKDWAVPTIYFCCYCYAFIVSSMLLARKLARALLIDLDFRNLLLTSPAIESGTFIILLLSPNSYYYTTLLLFLSMVCCCLLCC